MQYAKHDLQLNANGKKKLIKNLRPYFEHMFQTAPWQYFKGVI